MSLMQNVCFSLVVFSCVFFSTNSSAQQIRIAVASNFYHPLLELTETYSSIQKDKSPAPNSPEFIVSSGATGALFSQINHGAPIDIFFAADVSRPEMLEALGLTSYRQTYTIGKLAMWSLSPKVRTVNQLVNYQGRLAIAHEKLAPFGLAAAESLHKSGILSSSTTQIVRANNINQAFQFVDSGNAKIAFVAESQLKHAFDKFKDNKYLNYSLVPTTQYKIIEQQLVVLKSGKRNKEQQEAVMSFVAFILSQQAQSKLVTMGYKSI